MNNLFNQFWKYLILLLVISLTVIVINNIYNGVIPKVIADINNGVIGAILTTIITLVLLSNQTEKESLNNRNSVIFKEKLKIFNEFLSILNNAVKDGNLTNEEIKVILYSFAKTRIHMSAENAAKIAEALQSINIEFFYVNENEIPDYNLYNALYNKICKVFRHELYGQQNFAFESYEFPNLKEVSYSPRRNKLLPIKDIDVMVNQLNNCRNITKKKNGTQRIIFSVTPELVDNFRSMHNAICNIMNDLMPSFNLEKITINDKIYLGLPSVKYNYNNTWVATLSITEKKRIQIMFKTEKPDVYRYWFYEDGMNGEGETEFLSVIARDLKDAIEISMKKPE